MGACDTVPYCTAQKKHLSKFTLSKPSLQVLFKDTSPDLGAEIFMKDDIFIVFFISSCPNFYDRTNPLSDWTIGSRPHEFSQGDQGFFVESSCRELFTDRKYLA
jgi:hypothetical protein